MPRPHSRVLSRATLILLLALAPAMAYAEGPIARSARAAVATRAPELARTQRQPRAARGRGPGRIVAGSVVGAVGGFFAGGYLGAVIDGDCGGCDDPGFKGAIIGAPIGAVAGGILGGKFLF